MLYEIDSLETMHAPTFMMSAPLLTIHHVPNLAVSYVRI